MNTFLNGLTNTTNFGYTENGAVKKLTTRSDLLDMFAMGAAMRKHSDEDIILMFRKAFAENPVYAYALKAKGFEPQVHFAPTNNGFMLFSI